MENLSDDDFRSYMTDFQTYLHNISDLGPIEPLPETVNMIGSQPDAIVAAADSSINWSAMSNRAEHPTTGDSAEERHQEAEEDDEDRIVAEGCDLDYAKDPDLIPSEKHSSCYPDVAGEEEYIPGEKEFVEEIVADPRTDSDEGSKEEKTRNDDEWREDKPDDLECMNGFDTTAEQGVREIEQSEAEDGEALEKTGWQYFGDQQTLQSYEAAEEHGKQEDDAYYKRDEMMTSVEEVSPNKDGILLAFGGSTSKLDEALQPSSCQTRTDQADQEENSQEEEVEEEEGEDNFALDRSQTATLVKTARRSSVFEEEAKTSEETGSVDGDANASSGHQGNSSTAEVNYMVSSEFPFHMGTREEFAKDPQEEYIPGSLIENNVNQATEFYSADVENRNAMKGFDPDDEEANQLTSEGKQTQNGAQLTIYPSQVRKTNNFLTTNGDSEEVQHPNCCDMQSPEDQENEEEGRGLPEQGSVKTLLEQWRQIEQQKRKLGGGTSSSHDQPPPFTWSAGEQGEDDEMKPTKSRVRDEILRMRSQSCDPLASRKHNRLSPNDDDVPTVGKRVGRGRSRMENQEEDDDEHYRSQPSLTKAILAKFENLDLQAANSSIKPKTNKNFKWQVKETTRFCRPGFQPRSGR